MKKCISFVIEILKIIEMDKSKKICIKGGGTLKTGEKIIKYLKSLGGNNTIWDGNSKILYYGIDKYNNIQGWKEDEIPKGYKIIELPEETPKICIKGSRENGHKIIKYLKGLGASNTSNYYGGDKDIYYGISDNNIEGWYKKEIPKGYKIIELPEDKPMPFIIQSDDPHLLRANYQNLLGFGYFEGKYTFDNTHDQDFICIADSEIKSLEHFNELYVNGSPHALNFETEANFREAFRLPQDYEASLQFAKEQLNHPYWEKEKEEKELDLCVIEIGKHLFRIDYKKKEVYYGNDYMTFKEIGWFNDLINGVDKVSAYDFQIKKFYLGCRTFSVKHLNAVYNKIKDKL